MAHVNGVYHPTDSDPYKLTGTSAGSGDLGMLAADAGQVAMDAAAAALAESKDYTDDNVWDRGEPTISDTLDSLGPGHYRVRSLPMSSALNLPVNRIGSLVIEGVGLGPTDARLATFTTDNRPGGQHPLEQWKMSSDLSGQWTNDWVRTFPQADAVTSTNVRRIITSPNYELPISEGDLLIVTPSPVWFTDFREDAVGQTPSGWTPRWADPAGGWKVAADVAGRGGRVLRAEDTGSGRTALSWDVADGVTDAEVVIKYRSTFPQSSVRPTVRGGGVTGTETGYHHFLSGASNLAAMSRLLDGATLSETGPAVPWVADDWFIVRFRIQDTALKVKHWPAQLVEPDEWLLTWEVGSITTPGWVGLQRGTNSRMDVDWVGVATGGGRAPTRPVAS